MTCRGIRGATTVSENSPAAIIEATREMLAALAQANELRPADIVSVLFTVTPDLDAAFPACAARELGWIETALLDVAQAPVPGGLPRCIRVLIHWNTTRRPTEVRHVYLREAATLRPDWAAQIQGESTSAPGDRTTEADSPPPKTATEAPAVAYQGEPGAYSQEAIYQHFGPHAHTVACPSFEAIFAAVEEGQVTAGLLPVENSQAGSITNAYDLLFEHDLRVIGEVKLRVRHCLLAPQGTEMSAIRRVYSHPQALAQCDRYLKNRGWEPVPAYDTAGSARALAESRELGAGAIASALAGRIYGLNVLDTGIEDSLDNTTRFFLLGGKEAPHSGPSRTSIVFAVPNTPGALYHTLGEFANRGINLIKIESRPRRNQPWHYVFYVDLEGHWQDPPVGEALMHLLAHATFVKLLGSYPAAPSPAQD